jgi:hypothetical protein
VLGAACHRNRLGLVFRQFATAVIALVEDVVLENDESEGVTCPIRYGKGRTGTPCW